MTLLLWYFALCDRRWSLVVANSIMVGVCGVLTVAAVLVALEDMAR